MNYVPVPRWLAALSAAAIIGLAIAVVLLFTRMVDGEREFNVLAAKVTEQSSESTLRIADVQEQLDAVDVPKYGPPGPRGPRGPRGFPGAPGARGPQGASGDSKWPSDCILPEVREIYVQESRYDQYGTSVSVLACDPW